MKVVIKLGTRILTDSEGRLDKDNISRISGEVGNLLDKGHECLIVSSGAVGVGRSSLKMLPGDISIRYKQAAASIGQPGLMNIYSAAFQRQDRIVGQVLLTAHDFARRSSYLNIRNTLGALLELAVVPIINENDTVAIEELKFGDNDRIAGIIAVKTDADKLIMLTDVDGLKDAEGNLIKTVEKVTAEIEGFAGGSISGFGSGGMITKLKAARMASGLCGIDTYLASGRTPGVLEEILNGGNPGTLFKGSCRRLSQRKKWIANLQPAGRLALDKGAVKAVISENSSILAVGIVRVSGNFREGAPVICVDNKGGPVAIGLSNFSSDEIRMIEGMKSSEMKSRLNRPCEEVIHRDNLVLL